MAGRLITIDGQVYEVAAETPAGSLLLLNRSGILRERSAALERQLESVRTELAKAEAEAAEAMAR